MTDPLILKTFKARLDLAGCFAFIGEKNLDRASRFLQAAETTFAALARAPGTAAPLDSDNPRLQDVRCARVRRFKNYLVFFRPIDGGIEVIRVLHAAQDIDTIMDSM